MLNRLSLVLVVSCLLSIGSSIVGCGSPDSASAVREKTVQEKSANEQTTVKHYDPTRDPAADLAATIVKAKAANKRIILQVGGDWCGWCHRLDNFVADRPAVAEALHDGFVLLRVNKSAENDNAEFLSQYPKIPGYPHWYVLESDGTLLHSQGTAELEDGDSYSEPALVDFLHQWSDNASLAGV